MFFKNGPEYEKRYGLVLHYLRILLSICED